MSLSMPGDISPVKAPLSSKYIFCAARNMFELLIVSLTLKRAVNGGAKTIAPFLKLTTPFLIAFAKAIDSAIVLCIFQLPATIHFLIFHFLIFPARQFPAKFFLPATPEKHRRLWRYKTFLH